jgi:hypothetical protein
MTAHAWRRKTLLAAAHHPPYWVYASGGLDTFDTWNLTPEISPSAPGEGR